jgi:hypothetical protein
VLALPAGEAFWIGAIVAGTGVIALARGRDGQWIQLVGSARAGVAIFPGLNRLDGTVAPLARPAVEGVSLESDLQRVIVEIADAETFTKITGLPGPAPLDPGAAYGGWRLP